MIDDGVYEERRTPTGFLIKVRLSKMTYVVFTASGPEVPKGARNNSIVVPVPKVGFFGSEFRVSHFRLGDLSFVNARAGKMIIPYQHGSTNEIKSIFLGTGSASDALPVLIYHYPKKEDLMKAWESGEQVQILVVDEEIPRNEMVTLKIRYPQINILVIKRKISSGELGPTPQKSLTGDSDKKDVIDHNKVRAADLSRGENLNSFSENPVFAARIHLRNLELDKVKQLLLDYTLTPQDVGFILTFLGVMIKNENKKEELTRARSKLEGLQEVFRLSLQIIGMELETFESELDKGLPKETAYMIYALLEKEQDSCTDIEKEIVLWEWKLRCKQMM